MHVASCLLTIGFQDWTRGAEQYCSRFSNPRKVQVVKRNLDSVQAALKEREKRYVVCLHVTQSDRLQSRRQGASVEEMTAEVTKARAALETAQRDLKSMASLNRVST